MPHSIERANSMEFLSTAFRDVDDDDEFTNSNDISKWIGSNIDVSGSNRENEGDCHVDNLPVEGPRATEKVSTIHHIVGIFQECIAEVDHVVKEEAEREEGGKGVEVDVIERMSESQDEKVSQDIDIAPGVLAYTTSGVTQHSEMKSTSAEDEMKTKVQPELAGLKDIVAGVPIDGKENIGSEQTEVVGEVCVQKASSMLKVSSYGRYGRRRRALTVVTNLLARPQVEANASVDDMKEKVNGTLKENVPRRGRANTVIRPVLATGIEPAGHVGGTRLPSPKRRPHKGSVAFSIGTAIGTGANMDYKSTAISCDAKENSDDDGNDKVALLKGCSIKNVTFETGASLGNKLIKEHPIALAAPVPNFVDIVDDKGLQAPKEVASQVIKRRRGLTVCGVRAVSPILILPPSSNDNVIHDQDDQMPPHPSSEDIANQEDARDICMNPSEDVPSEADKSVSAGKEVVLACIEVVNVRDQMSASVNPARAVGDVRIRPPPRSAFKRRQQPERRFGIQELSGIEEENEENASSMDQTILSQPSTLNMHTDSFHKEHLTIMTSSGTDPDQTAVTDMSFKELTPDWRYQPVIAHAFPFDDPAPKKLVWEEVTGRPRSGASGSPTPARVKQSFSSSALVKIKQHITKYLGPDRTKSWL